MCNKYNGWSNRETWATMLHINNDHYLYEIAYDYAKQELEGHDTDEEINPWHLGRSLESWICDDLLTLENVQGNEGLWNMLTDIGSFYRVDWSEIAESLISNVRENERINA